MDALAWPDVRQNLDVAGGGQLKALDAALTALAAASPALKKSILRACAACIGADGQITVDEGELLRAIAAALDCPMPPLLAGFQQSAPVPGA